MAHKIYLEITVPKKVSEIYGDNMLRGVVEHKMRGLNRGIKVKLHTLREETGLGDAYVRHIERA